MKHVFISPLLPSVSRIALGCDHYGQTIPKDVAFDQMDLYAEHGGNVLDTARIYGQAEDDGPSSSEQLIGKWLKLNMMQKDMRIVTKGGHPHIGRMHDNRLDWRNLYNDIQNSLEQLGVDHIDMWLLHRDDENIPVEEIVDTIDEFVNLGFAYHVGVSNWSARRIQEANKYAITHGRHPLKVSQLQWSLAASTPQLFNDDTIVCMNATERSWYEENKFPLMCFSPQAKGLFSKIIAGDEASLSDKAKERFLTDTNKIRIQRCKELSQELGVAPASICLSYLTSQQIPTMAVIGSSRPEQLRQSLQDADLQLTAEQLAFLEG